MADLMPDFNKEDQYECECVRCMEHYLGPKRSMICPKCKLVDQAQELNMGYDELNK